jgi:hypothetical protein
MSIADAQSEYQHALEYRRVANERYSTFEELAECDLAVELAEERLGAAWLKHVLGPDA